MPLSASPLLSHDRRRELSRQVRDAFPQMGVYAIRNVTTGTVLVAASRDVPAAMNRIRFELQRKGCRNHQLQQDWDHFGPGAFRFEALELVREREDAVFDYAAELDTLLQLWTSELCPERGGAP